MVSIAFATVFDTLGGLGKREGDEIEHNESTTITDGSWMTSNEFKPDTTIAN